MLLLHRWGETLITLKPSCPPPHTLTMSFIVMSSSLLAPSISTLGRMATGGTARWETIRCSGRPT